MTNFDSSQQTKRKLANSLKKFMEIQPLSKITVSEIIQDCCVNRKTFYYHFADIDDLLKWTLEQEPVNVIKEFDLFSEYTYAILFIMDYVETNSHILNCAHDSMGAVAMQRFFYDYFIDIITAAVEKTSVELCIKPPKAFKQFLAQFYTEALSGMLVNIFKEDVPYSRDETIKNITVILKQSIPHIITAQSELSLKSAMSRLEI